MKKKIILSVFMVLICTGIIFLIKGYQQKAVVAEVMDAPKQTVQSVTKENKNTSSDVSTNKKTTTTKVESTISSSDKQVNEINFTVYDSVSNTYKTSSYVKINSGDTVSQVTIKALNGNCRATGSSGNVYFSSIMGISERSAGALSGWCFFVNGKKPGISSGSYKLQPSDKLVWKFLKDGTAE